MGLSRLGARTLFGAGNLLKAFGTRAVSTELSTQRRIDWESAVEEAERLVGYPSSFKNIRWLFSDELGDLGTHMRRIVGSSHPLLTTVKNLLYEDSRGMQACGLVVLLLSKAAGHSEDILEMEQDRPSGILYSQRTVAELAETIKISYRIHKSIVNLNDEHNEKIFRATKRNLTIGNKMALLAGDLLLVKTSTKLSELRNQELISLIFSAIRDLTESEFIGLRDSQNIPLPSRPKVNGKPPVQDYNSTLSPINITSYFGYAAPEWTARHEITSGILLAKCCQGSLILAKQPKEMQEMAYAFGMHMSLACQACLEQEIFADKYKEPFSLISAPVMFTLAYKPELYSLIDSCKSNAYKIDYERLYKEVLTGPGLEQTKDLQRQHANTAIQILEHFPNNDARSALHNLIVSM